MIEKRYTLFRTEPSRGTIDLDIESGDVDSPGLVIAHKPAPNTDHKNDRFVLAMVPYGGPSDNIGPEVVCHCDGTLISVRRCLEGLTHAAQDTFVHMVMHEPLPSTTYDSVVNLLGVSKQCALNGLDRLAKHVPQHGRKK